LEFRFWEKFGQKETKAVYYEESVNDFFTGKFSPNFKLKKYDFNLYKGFFIEKMA
jgi:hypothetical protein